MIPQRLQLHNFMSYRQNPEPMDFRGVELACLTGANGVGKSSLLEAITWVLWGKSRAKSDDELVHHGHSQMWVDFEFKLGRSYYRVSRKRTPQGRGQSSLDFMVKSKPTANWQSLAGVTKAETQDIITDALRMSYETFINSAFLRQGRADEFTIKRSQERKKVLADILNLSYYDQLADKAKAKVKEITMRTEGLSQQLDYVAAETKDKEKLKSEVVRIASELATTTKTIKAVEQDLAKLNNKKKDYDKKAAQLQNITARIAASRQDLIGLLGEEKEQAQIIKKGENLLQREKEIVAGHSELEKHRQLDTKLNKVLAERSQLLKQQADLEKQIVVAQSQRAQVLNQLTEKISQLQTKVREKDGLSREQIRLTKEIKRLLEQERAAQVLDKKIQTTKDKIIEKRLLLEQIVKQGQEIKEKAKALRTAKSAGCPLCTQNLTASHRRSVISQLQQKRTGKIKDYQVAKKEIAQGEKELKVLLDQSRLEQIKSAAKVKVESELLVVKSKLTEIKNMAVEVTALEKKKKELEQASKQKENSQDNNRLKILQQKLSKLSYNESKHKKISDKLKSLEKYADLKFAWERARDNKNTGEKHLRQIAVKLAAKKKERQALEKAQTEMKFDPKEAAKIKQIAARKEKELTSLRREEAKIQSSHGAAKEKEQRLRSLTQGITEKRKELKKLTKEKTMHEELVVAFGKKGIQAMIIEAAIPEIEQEANRLLTKMTDGRMQVRFLTQRQKKTGPDLMETLDIIIEDEMGVKNYEMFSGGEAYRINFAIRIALSKLLANRAGAKLQFLVIDEGFGTQDDFGRESLIEAINSISSDFAKILVITHIKEMKDSFPSQIEVTKDKEGSHYEVVV